MLRGYRSFVSETPEELGRRLVSEMSQPVAEWADEAWDGSATSILRWGCDDLSDATVWRALLAALDAADTEADLWGIADGFLDESVLVRPSLSARFVRLVQSGDPKAVALVAVMASDRWNWGGPDSVAAWQKMLDGGDLTEG